MRSFIKENLNRILLLILLGLLFVLWARVIECNFKTNDRTKELSTIWARIDCAKSFGWEVDPGSEIIEKIHIPNEFDEVYTEYNHIQKMCGFDLLHHRGKTAIKYTYIITNYPYELSEPVYINLYINEDKLIGGDIMTRSVGGFMLPLDRRFVL